MSINLKTPGRPRTPFLKGVAAVFALTIFAGGPLAAQTAPIFEDPMESLLGAPQEPARRPAAPIPFELTPDPRFQNRPAAPAPAPAAAASAAPASAPAPAARPASGPTMGFSAEPTRLDAQSLGQLGAQAGARGDQIVQGAAQRWGLSSATLYMLGALLGLLGLLLLARLFGFGQKPAKAAPRRQKIERRASPRTVLAPEDDWAEDAPQDSFAAASRRAAARVEPRPASKASVRAQPRRAAAPAAEEDWGDEPLRAASERVAQPLRGGSVQSDEESQIRSPRRPNLDRLAASIRETWPRTGEADAPEHGSPARAAAARVAREFAEDMADPEIPPQPRRGRPAGARGGGDFLDALEAAGENEVSGLDRIRSLTRAK